MGADGLSLSRRELLRRGALLAASGTGAAVLAACGDAEDDTLARARAAGLLRVGHANERPFGFVDTDGRLTGYSVEVVRRAAARLGIPRVEGAATEFGDLLDGLAAGAFDVVGAGMFVTADRCRSAVFATPDYCTGPAFIVRRGPLERARSLPELATGGRTRLGVLRGSVEVPRARGRGFDAERLGLYPDKAALRAALLAGEVDAVALTAISLRRLMADLPAERFALSELSGPQAPTRCGAAAFRVRDVRLRDAFSREIARAGRAGELVAIGRRFGLTPAELPPRAPVESARCGA